MDLAFADRAFKSSDSPPGKIKSNAVRLARSQSTKNTKSTNDDISTQVAGRYTSVSSLTSLFDVLAPSPKKPVSLLSGGTDEAVIKIRRVDLQLGLFLIGVLVLLWILFSVGGRLSRLEKRIDRLVEIVGAR